MQAVAETYDAGDFPQSSATYAWYVVFVLMLAQTVSFIDRMIMGLLVGPIRASFEISDTQYSLLAGFAFALFYSIMGLPLARIADSRNRTRLIAIAMVFWSLMTVLCGFAKGFWSLFLARIGVGVGEAALSPAGYSIITDYFAKSSLARALSVYTFGITIGSGLAYIVGGQIVALTVEMGTRVFPIIGETEGWHLTFFIVGFPGIVLALLVLNLREPKRLGHRPKNESDSPTNAVEPVAEPVPEVVAFMWSRRTALLTHIVGMSIFIMAVFSVNIWGPEYLIRTFGFTRSEAGASFGLLIVVAGTAGLLLGGILADKWFAGGQVTAYTRVILFSMIGMFPFIVALGFISTPAIGIACLGLAVFFSAFQGGISGGLIQLIMPNQMRGQGVALYFLVANLLGMGFGPTIVALTTDFVFRSDEALNKAIALCGGILIPIAFIIMLSGMKYVRIAIEDARTWEAST